MEKFSIKKRDGNIVSCVKAIPAQPKGIVIAVHGFSSSKESPTTRMLLERLPDAGLGVICIDLPGHGTEESAKETLRISGALDSIEAAEQAALREVPGCEICYFASSFGAYLTGLYISTRDHAGRKVFWRSAAVNMSDFFRRKIPPETQRQWLKDLETKGYFDTNMDLHKPVRITKAMYDDLLQNDLFERFDRTRFGTHRILMAHGREDAVIDPEAAASFAAGFRIPVVWFPGEGHSLSNSSSTPCRVADLAVSLFTGGKDRKKLFTEIPHMQSERITLRKVTESEADALQEMVNSPAVYRYLPTFLYEKKYPDIRYVIRHLYDECFQESIILGIFEKDRFCGLAEMYGYRDPIHKISIGYRLSESCWGRGIATEALRLMVEYLFHETDIEIITASTLIENRASANVLEKNGFTLVAHAADEDWGYEKPLATDKWIR